MSETTLSVEGMTCGHCKMRVEKAIKGIAGVTDAQADLVRKQVIVSGSADVAAIAQAVHDAGYSVVKQ